MKNLILFVLFSFATVFAQYADISSTLSAVPFNGNKAMWDVQFNYDMSAKTGANGNAGCVYIPTIQRFWTSRWASNLIHVWNTSGAVVDSFTLSTTGTRGMAFDGQYVYCSQNSATLQKIDPVTHTAVGTVVIPATVPNGARYITYDPTANSGAGGFWVGNWTSPNLNFYLISKTGAVLRTITNSVTGVYGLAFDNFSAGGPYLWVWSQGLGAGNPQVIQQMLVSTGTYTTVQHDVVADVGVGTTSAIAGGLFITTSVIPGKITLGGVLQGVPDKFFAYELGTVVPVELTSFTANAVGNAIQLNWATATETNNRGFEIQRRSSNTEFVTIGFVSGKGTTTEVQNYSFNDKASAGTFTYRLRQVDFNGRSEFSKSVEVSVIPAKFELLNNYPNPFNPSTNMAFNLPVDSKVSLNVYNLLGQQVATVFSGNLSAGMQEFNFNASGLSTGVYMYKLEAAGIDGRSYSAVKKMILNK